MPSKSWLPAWGDRNRGVEHFRGFKGQIDSRDSSKSDPAEVQQRWQRMLDREMAQRNN